MNILLIFTVFIIAFIIVFIVALYYQHKIKLAKPRNKVHAYVARDKNGSLWLYFNKPIRGVENFFGIGNVPLSQRKIKYLGLNKADYDNLKWEDEPVEVFINMED